MSDAMCAGCGERPVAGGDSKWSSWARKLDLCSTCYKDKDIRRRQREARHDVCAVCRKRRVSQGKSAEGKRARRFGLCTQCLHTPESREKRYRALGLRKVGARMVPIDGAPKRLRPIAGVTGDSPSPSEKELADVQETEIAVYVELQKALERARSREALLEVKVAALIELDESLHVQADALSEEIRSRARKLAELKATVRRIAEGRSNEQVDRTPTPSTDVTPGEFPFTGRAGGRKESA